MRKNILFVLCGLFSYAWSFGQELFINSEPASNMAAHALGLRLGNYAYQAGNSLKIQTGPELMYGFSSGLMVHASAYADNRYTTGYVMRDLNLYAKYRLYIHDGLQTHFRLAAYSRLSYSLRPDMNNEAAIEGDYSGAEAGVVATQLLHRLALSAGAGYIHIISRPGDFLRSGEAVEYNLSAGYLVLPKQYKDYNQTNMNLYLELLGKAQNSTLYSPENSPASQAAYLDLAPGVQFIIRSRARVDLSWRTQLVGNLQRPWHSLAFVRLEYNIFNI